MRGEYYLNDYMLKNKKLYSLGKLNYNNSPAGSGKSTHIFCEDGLIFNSKAFIKEANECFSNSLENIIYVTDNNMNKENILENYKDITVKWDRKIIEDIEINNSIDTGKVAVLTYAQFANLLKNRWFRQVLSKNVKLIIMDEFHNLFDYANKFDEEANKNYSNIINNIENLAKKTLLITLSATPYYIEEGIKNNKNNNIRKIFNEILNNKDLKNIRRYEEKNIVKTLYPINFIKKMCLYKIPFKALIYVERVETEKKYKELLKKAGYSVEYLCSSKKNNNEQNQLRDYIIKNKKLPKNIDILIINRAYDTGWDLKDEAVKMVIVDSVNPTIITQARNRCRHDLDWFIYKCKNKIKNIERVPYEHDNGKICWCYDVFFYDTEKEFTCNGIRVTRKYNFKPFKFVVDEKFLGVRLTPNRKQEFKKEIIDKYGRKSINETTFKDFKEDLKENGYIVTTIKEGRNKGIYITEIKGDKKMVDKTKELCKQLEAMIGKELYAKEREELIKKINVRRDGKLIKGYKAINEVFEEQNISYKIIAKTDWTKVLENGERNINYGKIYWIIVEND